MNQLSLFEWPDVSVEPEEHPPAEPYKLLPLEDYSLFIVSYSTGKDSTACLLHLLELGVPKEKIRLWHQRIDGDGSDPFMDWPSTERYCELIAEKFGIQLEYQWREDGFKGELLKENDTSKPVTFEYGGGTVTLPPSNHAKPSTRKRWPALSANLMVRWCSSNLKIEIATRAINNYPDFQKPGIKILVITGERREESPARSKYAETLPHKSNSLKRRVDQWRAIIDWKEQEVWDIFQRFNLLPHPAYLLGFSRVSCFGCIFNTPDLWAMIKEIDPTHYNRLVQMEKELGFTIDHKLTLEEKAAKGKLDRMPVHHPDFEKWLKWALTKDGMTLSDLDGFVWPAGAMNGADGGAP